MSHQSIPSSPSQLKQDADYWCRISYANPPLNPAGIATPDIEYDCTGKQQYNVIHIGISNHTSVTALMFTKLSFSTPHDKAFVLEVYTTSLQRALPNLHIDTITAWARRIYEHTLHGDTTIRVFKRNTPININKAQTP